MTLHTLFAPGGSTEVKQDSILTALASLLTELQQKLETGQAVALDAPTLAALESITATISGSVAVTGPLTDAQLRASAVPVSVAGAEYTHVVATVTATGDTTVHTPASGKAIRLRWVYAINDPTASTPTLINIKIGAVTLYRAWAISKSQVYTGAVNAPLVVNLSATGTVAFTAIIEEV